VSSFRLEPGRREWVATILRRYSGVVLTDTVQEGLDSTVAAVASDMGVEPEMLLRQVGAGDPEAMQSLVERALVSETYFLRHPEHFDALRDLAWTTESAHRLRIWTAGCSTGEEAYSVALTLLAAGRQAGQDQILGTDISERALERAKIGRYGSWSFRRVGREVRTAYFKPVGWEMEVIAPVRAMVEFRRHHLLDEPPPAVGWDAIFCRNVLIYFDPETAAKSVRTLAAALRPGGLLLLGIAEVPLADGVGLERVEHKGQVLLRRPVSTAAEEVTVVSRQQMRRPSRPPRPITPLSDLNRAGNPASSLGTGSAARPPTPSNASGLSDFELAKEMAARGELEQARSVADKLVRAMKPEGYLLLALIAESGGDLEGAEGALRRAVALQPALAQAHAMRAALLARMGRRAEAEQSRQNALDALEGLSDAEPLIGLSTLTAGALRRALSQGR
jgi:chemotaxis protein methyltransferase CheR